MTPVTEQEILNDTAHLQQLLEEKEFEKLADELFLLPEVEAVDFL